MGLLIARALLQLTAKLAQQANFLSSVYALANSTLLKTNWMIHKKADLCHQSQ